ncbi:MAG: MFS transporter, partial [Ardenticatenia bacterium]
MRAKRLFGTEPWHRTLAIAFLAQLMAGLGFSLVFPFLPLYVQYLGIRTSGSVEFWSGIVFAVQAFTMMLSAPVWGSLADRYGRKLMVQRATFGGAVVLLAMGFARSAEELAILRAIQGLITGTVTATIALVAAATPRKHSGFALGLLQVALWAGIAVGPIIGGVMADTVGFRATFILTSTLLFLAGVLVHFGIHEPPRTPQPTEARPSLLQSWREVLHLPGVLPTFAVRFLNNVSRMSVMPLLPLFVQSLMSNSNAVGTMTGLVSGIGSAMSTLSAVVLGRVGDKVGHKRVLVFAAILAAAGYVPQALVTSPWQLILLNGITGAAVGGILPALGALLAQYSP